MKSAVTSFFAGLVFALGLGISGMTRPIKVIGFLDFFGQWDASLALVMVGAIGIYFLASRFSRTMPAPWLEPKFAIPSRTDVDRRLVAGAVLFGIGWGLAGFCPGPAITSLASGASPVAVFVAAMAVGIYVYGWTTSREVSPARDSSAGLRDAVDA